jgi:hypothetical protein
MEAKVIGVSENVFASEFIFQSLITIGDCFDVTVN